MKQKISALLLSFILVFTLPGHAAEKEQLSAYVQAEKLGLSGGSDSLTSALSNGKSETSHCEYLAEYGTRFSYLFKTETLPAFKAERVSVCLMHV